MGIGGCCGKGCAGTDGLVANCGGSGIPGGGGSGNPPGAGSGVLLGGGGDVSVCFFFLPSLKRRTSCHVGSNLPLNVTIERTLRDWNFSSCLDARPAFQNKERSSGFMQLDDIT